MKDRPRHDPATPVAPALSRRHFLQSVGVGVAAAGLSPLAFSAEKKVISGFEPGVVDANTSKGWQPVSDRRLRVGLVGHGYCRFASNFSFQDHPNVEIVAVSDLIPERCAEMAKMCRCAKTYPSLEELVRDDRVEAVFICTDAPSHARHAIEALQHGKHVAVAVPAVFGSLEEADRLLAAVKTSGLKYMMYETSCFHPDLYAMRQIYQAGGFGQLVYSEGEYFHYVPQSLPSYRDWRVGLPPLWYATHSTAYYVGVTGGSFTEVSCTGTPSNVPHLQAPNNRYGNPFGTETALFRTREGGMSRMMVSKDTAGYEDVAGRIRGQRGSYYHNTYEGLEKNLPKTNRPPLPPGVQPGGHKGSHGHLTEEFVTAVLKNRPPMIDVVAALNMTVPGIVAHASALRDGERMKIPQYKL